MHFTITFEEVRSLVWHLMHTARKILLL